MSVAPLLDRLRAALTGRYEVERELGQGGMATVFLAHDAKHERRVAIKVLGPDLAVHVGTERFLREIKTAAQLTHPNILPLYDSGEADGLLYYVMPFVAGGSLRDRLRQDGALPFAEALRIAQEVADALHLAHTNGFLHRDIKPENILFVAGRPVLADFGIARAISAAGEQLTQTGMAIGTPAYMSPEQASGEPNLDARSDVYALGCVLYEMLVGRPPFQGRNMMEILARQATDEAPPVRTSGADVPAHVEQTVARALAKDPADRFASAREFADAMGGRLAAGRSGVAAIFASMLTGRVLAIAAGYALVTVVAWAGVRWLADRLALSPHLPVLVLVALALLLPALLAVASVVGRRGVRWRAAHTAGLAANLAVAVAVLVLLFGGKDLGAVTTAVTLTDEDGNRVERVIPKGEFRTRLALFNFDADSSDARARLLAYGLPDAIGVDLLQDLFIDVREPPSFRRRLVEAGYPQLVGVPLALARDIAAEQFRDVFATGRVRTEGDEVVATVTVYRTATGAQLRALTVRGTDPLALADEIAANLRGTANVPEGYGATVDLPVSELMTQSPAAFAHYVRGKRALVIDNDWAAGAASLEAAVAEDSTFAFAHYLLWLAYVVGNRAAEAQRPIEAAVNHAYRLPERMRNTVKANYYEMRREMDKTYALIEMNAELYPTDVLALTALAQIQQVRGQRREAIATFQRILAVDPQQHDYLRAIGDLYRFLGESEQALEYYERYNKLNPKDRRGFLAVGDLRSRQGEHEAARAAYQRAALLTGGEQEAALRIAHLDLYVGRMADARRGFDAALADARTAADSARAWDGLADDARYRGRIRDMLAYRERGWAEAAKYSPPIAILTERLNVLGDYVTIGDTARAYELLQRYKAALVPPFEHFRPLGDLDIALALEDPARIESATGAFDSLITRSSFEVLRSVVVSARGESHYLRGNYREAIAAWEEEARLSPTDPSPQRKLGQAYRELGEYRRAEASFQRTLRVRPADARAHYELALLEEARGRREAAVAQLRAALTTWAEADATHKWARRARDKLAQLVEPAGR